MKRQKKMRWLVLLMVVFAMAANAGAFVVPTAPYTDNADTVVLYHMDEGSGTTIADASSNNRDATLTVGGATGGWVSGQTGFDDAVNMTVESAGTDTINWSGTTLDLGGIDAFTVEAWIKPSNFSASDQLFSIGSGYGSLLGVSWPSTASGSSLDEISVYTYAGGHQTKIITLSTSFTTGEWQHIAVVYKKTGVDASAYEIYRNGSLIGSADNAFEVDNPDDDELHIGVRSGGAWYHQYEGDIDEFRISTVAIPEPATVALLATGFILFRRNRK